MAPGGRVKSARRQLWFQELCMMRGTWRWRMFC